MARSLVIIPTYNERENLRSLVADVLELPDEFDVLIVDDHSPDGTGQLADALAAGSSRVHVLHRAGKLGLGTAYVTGFKFALRHRYDVVFEMDADYSHNPADLPRLLAALKHADIAIGSRWVRGGGTSHWSWLRTLISRGGSLYARLLLGIPVRDLTSGFKAFRSSVLAGLDLDAIRSNGYAFQIEVNDLCCRRGARFAEIPILFTDRRVGRSKMGTGIVLEAVVMCWRLRLTGRRPARAAIGRWAWGSARGVSPALRYGRR